MTTAAALAVAAAALIVYLVLFGITEADASVRQSSQMEILTMAFNRHGERLDRIETRLDHVDQRLGLDQKTH
jgi:hypothetical protein